MNDPSVLSTEQLLQIAASTLEVHSESIFVYAKDGRRFIAELRKRAGDADPPIKEDISAESFEVVANNGEIAVKVDPPRPRTRQPDDAAWMPNPIPGRANIRVSVVDDAGVVADMEFGNADETLAKAVCSMLVKEHAEGLKRRNGERS